MLLVEQQEGIWSVKDEWWGAGMVICLSALENPDWLWPS